MVESNLEMQYLRENIQSEQDQLKRFLMRLISDVLFRGDSKLVIVEELAGVSTFKSRTIMRNYPCSPQFCIQVLQVFFPEILNIEKHYPPKWMRWFAQPTFNVTFQQSANQLIPALQVNTLPAMPMQAKQFEQREDTNSQRLS